MDSHLPTLVLEKEMLLKLFLAQKITYEAVVQIRAQKRNSELLFCKLTCEYIIYHDIKGLLKTLKENL